MSSDGSRSRSRSRSPSHRKSSHHNEEKSSRDGKGDGLSEEEKRMRKEAKERLKAMETPEEKRMRRLAKKAAKDEHRREKVALGAKTYSASDNPFGDQNINDRFVWHKKYESLETQGVSRDEVMRKEKKMRSENVHELEKVRKAREQRELEKSMMEQEQDRNIREKEDEKFSDWIKQEDSFHLNQAVKRSEIRLREGRAKPIDLAARYINTSPDDADISMHEPYVVMQGLGVADLEDLLEDIGVYSRLEKGLHSDYWHDMTVICEHALADARRVALARDPTASEAERRAADTGISPQVRASIQELLQGKTLEELLELQTAVRGKVSGGAGLDTSYWEALASDLADCIAKARLRRHHQDLLRRTLQRLGGDKSSKVAGPPSGLSADTASAADPKAAAGGSHATHISGGGAGGAAKAVALQAPRSFSPEPLPLSSVPAETVLVEPALDGRRLELMRLDVMQRLQSGRLAPLGPVAVKAGAGVAGALVVGPPAAGSGAAQDSSDLADMMYKAEAERGMGEDEESFNEDLALPAAASHSWKGDHRPRKPRFFNRVLTGFEWNQYNRTHYDTENLPPKVVQGYKFNIFYPDLFDKTKSPTFTVKPIPSEPGFSTIRFHAGPPYEDLAFKIVDMPWLYSRRTGFRCQLDRNNVFQLWFVFRRERYRR